MLDLDVDVRHRRKCRLDTIDVDINVRHRYRR